MDKNLQYLNLAKHVSTWSKDPSTKCGAIITDKYNRIIGTGFNGFPRGYPDTPEEYSNRENKYNKIIHAEINAILFSTRSLVDCTMYVYPMLPCCRCASIICNTEIIKVVAPVLSEGLKERWGGSIKITKELFDKCNKEFLEINFEGLEISLKPKVKLIGSDGNAFSIISKVVLVLEEYGYSKDIIDKYRKEAISGDYNNLLNITSKYVDIV